MKNAALIIALLSLIPFAQADSVSSNPSLVVFTMDSCGYCQNEMAYLKTKNIYFTQVRIETEQGRKRFDAAGGLGTPLTLYGQHRYSGFSEEGMDEFIAIHEIASEDADAIVTYPLNKK